MVDKPEKPKKPSDWELEAPFDFAATLNDLIEAPPFKQASDEQGQSVTAGTRVPAWLFRRVMKLAEAVGSPYEIASDVLRDAIYNGLQILYMRHKVSPDWEVEKKLAAVVDATGASKRIRDQFEELVSALEDMYKEGDEKQAADKLTEYVLAATELENEWHRKKLFRLLGGSKIISRVMEMCNKSTKKLIDRGGR